MENALFLMTRDSNLLGRVGPTSITTVNRSHNAVGESVMDSMMRGIGAEIRQNDPGYRAPVIPDTWYSSENIAQVTCKLVGLGYNVASTSMTGGEMGGDTLVVMQLRSDLVTGPVNT